MRKALSVFGDGLLLLAGLFGVALLVMRLAGIQFFAVQTGSMGKDYPVGSLVVVYSCEPEQVQTDDVITYLLAGKTKTYVTHRVISIDADGRCFVTQGDANNTPDKSTVPFSSFLGKVICCIPKLGYPLLWLGTAGRYFLIAAVAIFVLFSAIRRLLKKTPAQEEKDAQ